MTNTGHTEATSGSSRSRLRWSGSGPRIGLWGPQGSGKTLFFSALFFSTYEDHGRERWGSDGTDHDAIEKKHALMEAFKNGVLPSATFQIEEPLSWRFNRTLADGKSANGPEFRGFLRTLQRLRRRALESSVRLEFELQIQDLPGAIFDFSSVSFQAQRPMVIEHLSQADGFVYLFDPSTAAGRRHGQDGFLRMVELLKAHARASDRLPHHLAVCISKFDDPEVFNIARRRLDMPKSLHVSQFGRIGDNAEILFDHLCELRRADFVNQIKESIKTNFDPSRVSYHATSATGFHCDAQDRVVEHDFCNIWGQGDQKRLKSRPNPVEVLEPIVAMAERIVLQRPRRR